MCGARTQPKLNFLRKAWVRNSDGNKTLGQVPGLDMRHRLKNSRSQSP